VSKKFVLRLSEDKYQKLVSMSGENSLNQYINEILDGHILKIKGSNSHMEKIIIGELQNNEVREAVTVTQKPWYMDILDEYKIYFFSPNKIVSPMSYLLFYGDSDCHPAKSISRFGKVSHIYRHVTREDIASIPELREILNDPKFADKILSWDKYQIVILSEVSKLENPLPLTKEYINHPRIIVNRETTIAKFLSAKKIDNLF
jgi:predicted CopG family antitoxin